MLFAQFNSNNHHATINENNDDRYKFKRYRKQGDWAQRYNTE